MLRAMRSCSVSACSTCWLGSSVTQSAWETHPLSKPYGSVTGGPRRLSLHQKWMSLVDLGRPAHAVEVLPIYRSQTFHAPSNLPVNGASIEHVDAFASFAVGVPVAEVVDIAERFAFLSLHEGFQLLQKIGPMGRLVACEDLQDAASSVRQEEKPLVILGVGNSSHDHGEEVGILRGAVEQQARKLSNSRSSFTVDRSRNISKNETFGKRVSSGLPSSIRFSELFQAFFWDLMKSRSRPKSWVRMTYCPNPFSVSMVSIRKSCGWAVSTIQAIQQRDAGAGVITRPPRDAAVAAEVS